MVCTDRVTCVRCLARSCWLCETCFCESRGQSRPGPRGGHTHRQTRRHTGTQTPTDMHRQPHIQGILTKGRYLLTCPGGHPPPGPRGGHTQTDTHTHRHTHRHAQTATHTRGKLASVKLGSPMWRIILNGSARNAFLERSECTSVTIHVSPGNHDSPQGPPTPAPPADLQQVKGSGF